MVSTAKQVSANDNNNNHQQQRKELNEKRDITGQSIDALRVINFLIIIHAVAGCVCVCVCVFVCVCAGNLLRTFAHSRSTRVDSGGGGGSNDDYAVFFIGCTHEMSINAVWTFMEHFGHLYVFA